MTTNGGDTPIITVNQINLTGKQLWSLLVACGTMIAGGFAGGYLFVPAKATDLTDLSRIVQQLNVGQTELRAAVTGLVNTTNRLADTVADIRIRTPNTIVSPRSVPRKRQSAEKVDLPIQ